MHAEHLLGTRRRFGDARDRNRARVRRVDCVVRQERLDLAQDAMLEIDVLEHRLDHEIDVAEPGVFRRRAGQRHHVVELLPRDLLLGISFSDDLADGGQSLADARRIRVLQPNERPLLHGHRRDPGTHEAGAQNAELLDGVWRRRGRGDARIFLERVGGEEEKDELTRNFRHRELAEPSRLLAEAGVDTLFIASAYHVERGERSRILSMCLLHHALPCSL